MTTKASKILSLYQEGLSLKKVAQQVGLKSHVVRRVLEENKTPRRSLSEASRKYKVNNNFFETIDNEEKAYWLGFIAADGCILNKKPILSLNLSLKDKDHLEKFKEALDSNYPIRNRKSNKGHLSCAIHIRSPKICSDLIDKGVIPRKSLILKPPKNIPSYLIRHWIRGYFDGDGGVSIHIDKRGNPSLKTIIVGTQEVLEFILKQTGLDQTIRQAGNSKAFRFQTQGFKKGLLFYHYLYDDATIYMERKKDKFEEYIEKKEEYKTKNRKSQSHGFKSV